MIFPTLAGKKFGYVSLNTEALNYVSTSYDFSLENEFLNPELCQQMVESVHKKYGVDFSYGGWMEDRSFLWRKSYLETRQTFIHLGSDLLIL